MMKLHGLLQQRRSLHGLLLLQQQLLALQQP
jgi:hypothetical protein